MDRRSVADHQGSIHTGLFNAYTGDFIDVACDAGRYAVVHHYEKLDPARLTDAPASCAGCQASALADVAREIADAVLADADRRGYPPALDDEGLRLTFVRLAPDAGELRPVLERLARGVYDPENSYRTQPLYALVREHLADLMTERAMEEPPEGTPRVLVDYRRYTGGHVQAPVGVGDRLMKNGLASGIWYTVTVTAIEPTDWGITVQDKDGWTHQWDRSDFHRWFFKLDRAPLPAATTA